MEVLYSRCAGLDVHKATVVAGVRLAAPGGKVVREVRTFGTTTASLLELAEWLTAQGCTHAAMEATGVYWKPVWHILAEGGFALVLANAAQVRNVPGRKTDVGDATWLAELLAHGLIRASFVPDTQTQELRALLRTRKQLVRPPAYGSLRHRFAGRELQGGGGWTRTLGWAWARRSARPTLAKTDPRPSRGGECRPAASRTPCSAY